MSTGLSVQETMYLQWLCNNAWQYTSGSIGDATDTLAKSIAKKVATGQLASTVPLSSFIPLIQTDHIDMGTF